MEWEEAARPDITEEETHVWKPETKMIKCACCGKIFEQYTTVADWAWKIGATKPIKLCCSYTCKRKLEQKLGTKHEHLVEARKRREKIKKNA